MKLYKKIFFVQFRYLLTKQIELWRLYIIIISLKIRQVLKLFRFKPNLLSHTQNTNPTLNYLK
jgi:hypothetical protein